MKLITWSDNTGIGVPEVTGVQKAGEWVCPIEIGDGPVEDEGPGKENSSWSQKWGDTYSVDPETENIRTQGPPMFTLPHHFWLETETESIVETLCSTFFIFKHWTAYEVENMNLTLYAPSIILQYVYEPTRCTKFFWLDFIFY